MPAKMWKETSKAKLWQDWSLVINLTSHGREASVILKYHSVSRRQRMSCTGKCGGSGINITETEKAAAKHPKCLQSAVWWSTRSPLTLQWHTSFWNGYLLYLFLPEKNRKRDSRVVEGNFLGKKSPTKRTKPAPAVPHTKSSVPYERFLSAPRWRPHTDQTTSVSLQVTWQSAKMCHFSTEKLCFCIQESHLAQYMRPDNSDFQPSQPCWGTLAPQIHTKVPNKI